MNFEEPWPQLLRKIKGDALDVNRAEQWLDWKKRQKLFPGREFWGEVGGGVWGWKWILRRQFPQLGIDAE